MVKNLGKAVLWVEEIGASTVVDPMSGVTFDLNQMATFERTEPTAPGGWVAYGFCEKDPREYAHRAVPVSIFLRERGVIVNVYAASHRVMPAGLVMNHGEALARRAAIGQTVNGNTH